MIKVGLVDDHAIVRSGLKQFFSEHVDLRVAGEAASGREAIDLELPLIPRALWADPRVRQDTGRFALMRGPLVYCAEGIDNGDGLNALTVTGDPAKAGETIVDDLGGAVALDVEATRDLSSGFEGSLYRESPPSTEPAQARFVPYHLWDNRAPGEMLVWMRGGPKKTGA